MQTQTPNATIPVAPEIRLRAARPTAKVVWSRAHTRRTAVEVVLFLLLAVGGGLLLYGANFGNNMVHDQLSAQKIYFPPRIIPTTFRASSFGTGIVR